MAKQDRYRKLLSVVIAGSMLGALVGLLPTALDRVRETAGGAPERAVLGAGGRSAAEAALVAPSRAAVGTEPEARRRQQLEMLREDLARRAEAVSVREEALRRDLLETFWKRQAAATVATVCLALVVVGLVVWRLRGSGLLTTDLRAEETRLRSLQMAVIGALEEFETKLQQAQRAAPGMASAPESPAAEAAPAGAAAARAGAEAVPAGAEAARFGADVVPAGADAAPEEGSFFAEEHEPPAGPPAAPPAPTSSFFDEPDALWETARESLLRDLRGRETAGSEAASNPARERTGTSWARRFLEPAEEADPFAAAPSRWQVAAREDRPGADEGPWGEPAHRPAPVASESGPGPSNPRSRIRAQIEYLSSEGWTEGEIARRLGVSREEVRLTRELRSRGMSGRPLAAG